jgi:Uma2 family endonuclease
VAGVPEYWIIDRETRQFFVYRDPVLNPAGFGTTAYRTHRALGPTESVAPLAVPEVQIRFSDLFR